MAFTAGRLEGLSFVENKTKLVMFNEFAMAQRVPSRSW